MLKPFTGLDSLENLNGEQLSSLYMIQIKIYWPVNAGIFHLL